MKKKSRFNKSALGPALLSALVAPGVGQIANREFGKGALLLTGSVGAFLWFSRVVTEQLRMLLPGTPEQWMQDQTIMRDAIIKLVNQNPQMFMTFQLLIVTVWVFGVVDAYVTARKRFRLAPPPEQ